MARKGAFVVPPARWPQPPCLPHVVLLSAPFSAPSHLFLAAPSHTACVGPRTPPSGACLHPTPHPKAATRFSVTTHAALAAARRLRGAPACCALALAYGNPPSPFPLRARARRRRPVLLRRPFCSGGGDAAAAARRAPYPPAASRQRSAACWVQTPHTRPASLPPARRLPFRLPFFLPLRGLTAPRLLPPYSFALLPRPPTPLNSLLLPSLRPPIVIFLTTPAPSQTPPFSPFWTPPPPPQRQLLRRFFTARVPSPPSSTPPYPPPPSLAWQPAAAAACAAAALPPSPSSSLRKSAFAFLLHQVHKKHTHRNTQRQQHHKQHARTHTPGGRSSSARPPPRQSIGAPSSRFNPRLSPAFLRPPSPHIIPPPYHYRTSVLNAGRCGAPPLTPPRPSLFSCRRCRDAPSPPPYSLALSSPPPMRFFLAASHTR